MNEEMKKCKFCGEEILSVAIKCKHCKSVLDEFDRNNTSDNDLTNSFLRFLVPVGRSGFSITAGYLGLFFFIPFAGLFAIIFGFLGINARKLDKNKKGLGRAYFGIIMGVLSSILYLYYYIVSL